MPLLSEPNQGSLSDRLWKEFLADLDYIRNACLFDIMRDWKVRAERRIELAAVPSGGASPGK